MLNFLNFYDIKAEMGLSQSKSVSHSKYHVYRFFMYINGCLVLNWEENSITGSPT